MLVWFGQFPIACVLVCLGEGGLCCPWQSGPVTQAGSAVLARRYSADVCALCCRVGADLVGNAVAPGCFKMLRMPPSCMVEHGALLVSLVRMSITVHPRYQPVRAHHSSRHCLHPGHGGALQYVTAGVHCLPCSDCSEVPSGTSQIICVLHHPPCDGVPCRMSPPTRSTAGAACCCGFCKHQSQSPLLAAVLWPSLATVPALQCVKSFSGQAS